MLVSFERTADRIAVWVVNDSPAPVSGSLALRRARLDGQVLGELSCAVDVAPGEARRCLDATNLGPIRLRDEFLLADLDGNQATYTLIGERYLHLPQATLAVQSAGGAVHVSTDVYARQVALEVPGIIGAVFEDNFFDLAPGQSRTIQVIHPAGGARVRVGAVNAQHVQVSL